MKFPGKKLVYFLLGSFLALYILRWIPWLVIAAQADIFTDIHSLEHADAAIIFGGLHYSSGELSETSRERLGAGAALFQAGITDQIVVSNTFEAAEEMKQFLVRIGIPEEHIEMDTTAIVTEDTCVAERQNYPGGRSVIFVSHGYHLPRILFSCKKLGVTGVGIRAEAIARTDRDPLPWYTVLHTRFSRSQREASLTFLQIFGLYGPTIKN